MAVALDPENASDWQHLGVALQEENGIMIFSGSAVVDENNTSGLGTKRNPPMVAIYTGHRVADAMQSQCIATSLDRGRTWTKYAGNPVIPWEKDFRDPSLRLLCTFSGALYCFVDFLVGNIDRLRCLTTHQL